MMRPVLLTSRAARTCVHRVRLDNDPDAYFERVPPTPTVQRRMEAGRAFEDAVVTELLTVLGPRAVDLRALRDPDETVAMMDRGVELIIGGQLPDDDAGGRRGIPDLLVHVGEGKYLPGDIKHHHVTKAAGPRSRSKPAVTSPLENPAAMARTPGRAALGAVDDLTQLAHYSRMLQALGRHPAGRPLAALVGNDDDQQLRLTWFALDGRDGVTHEPADPAGGTVLDLYDARHHLRLEAAAGHAATVPVRRPDCADCHWLARCQDDAGPDAASFAVTTGGMKPRDWLALRDLGVHTVTDLAGVDLSDPTWESRFAPASSTPKEAMKKLAAARLVADMVAAGETIRRTTTGPLEVPAADVEVDIDYEWDPANLVYLWGGTVRRGPSLSPGERGVYYPVVEWDPMDADRERELAGAFVAWLRAIIAKAGERGRTVAIFHYSHPERSQLVATLGEEAVADVLAHFVDVLPLVKKHFVGAHGLGIKKVAPAFGFTWADDDPGGLQSQEWLLRAQETDDRAEAAELHTRILRYNEDDVRATAAIRDGMRRRYGAGT